MNSVRCAEARDIPAILDLLVQVDMVHHNGRPDLFKGPATKYSAEELERILVDEETPVFVCTDEQNRVLGHGFCDMQHSGGQLMEEHTTVYIDDICVDEEARGKHVGSALYEAVKKYAQENDYYHINIKFKINLIFKLIIINKL